MAHQEGWIDLYVALEEGRTPEPGLVNLCKSSRTGIGETMLHWYAIEGDPSILQKLIDLGFEVNVVNEFGNSPIMESAAIGRWDNAKVLYDNGAKMDVINDMDEDIMEYLDDRLKRAPEWFGRAVQKLTE